ncbi:hypothetical protein LPJ59_006148, partial [Coemansia sp. RSA 2399]
MRFSGMPESIQAAILTKALADIGDNYHTWKQSLQILAVCSLWRTMCRPVVYKTAFVECRKLSQDGEARPGCLPAPPVTKILSNLHLISRIGVSDIPTHIKLVTDTNKHTVDVLEICADIVRYSRVKLVNVKKITIELNVWRYAERSSMYTFSEQKRAVSVAVSSLVQACPSIEAIESSGASNSSLVNYVTSSLASKYSDRLASITSNAVLPVLDLDCCANITHLETNISPLALPYISTLPVEKLRYLCLNISIPRFPWELLAKENQNTIVNFPRLSDLRVRYKSYDLDVSMRMLGKSMQAKEDPSTTRIICPVLERLEMRCSSQDHVLQSSLQSLTSIRSLCLEDTVTGLLYLRSIVLPSLQCIAIHTTYGVMNSSLNGDGVLVLNTLLQSMLLPPKVGLRIGCEVALDTPDDIRWDAVTDLTIASFVDSRIMLKLLCCMPSLTRYQVNVETPDENTYLNIVGEQATQNQP